MSKITKTETKEQSLMINHGIVTGKDNKGRDFMCSIGAIESILPINGYHRIVLKSTDWISINSDDVGLLLVEMNKIEF